MIDKAIKGVLFLMVFLLPLFFTTAVPSVLELNKQFLLIVMVGTAFLLWVGKMIWLNEVYFRRDFVLVPILTLLLVIGLSTLFSIYPQQSMWGVFGKESHSFISLLCLVAFFLLVFNNFKKESEVFLLGLVFLIGSVLAGIFAYLQTWGVFILPWDILKNPTFNTIGTIWALALFTGSAFILSVALALREQTPRFLKITLLVIAGLLFLALLKFNLFFKIWLGIILCLVALLAFVVVKEGQGTPNKLKIVPMLFLAFAFFAVIMKDLPREVNLPQETSLGVAFASFKENALLGKGPVTYDLVFQKFRPESVAWPNNFSEASSYFMTLMSTVGILGTVAFVFMFAFGLVIFFRGAFRIISSDQKRGGDDFLFLGFGLVWLLLGLSFFFYSVNLTVLFVWWLSLGALVSLSFMRFGDDQGTVLASPRSSLVASFVFVLVMMGFLAMIYTGGQKYFAAINFKDALESDAQSKPLDQLGGQILKAVQADPQRDEYHRNLSVVFYAMANKRAAEKDDDLSAEDLNFISGMIKSSLQESESAKNLNPDNPQNYLSLARVYEGILATTEEADKKAVENYQKAIELDPRNPSLYHKIANVYVTMFDLARAKNQSQSQNGESEITKEERKYLLLAKENLAQALEINSNFFQSKMFLTEIHQREGDMAKAISNEEEIKSMAPNSPQISFRLGLLYYQNEQKDQAQKELERTVSLDKNHLTARYFLGLLYEEDGNTDKALEQFEKIAELDEENEEIKQIIENVKAGRDPLAGVLEEGQEEGVAEEIFQETREQVEEETQPGEGEEGQTEIDPELEDQQLPPIEEEGTF